ncbi:hypothetical protein PM082_012490 [Marasmius tenuissimus]|nr:hypothetical protein PM082_012490 [Marasmius tenuissimus]
MGIASTLVVVRSTLGIAVHDEKSFKASVLEVHEGEDNLGAPQGWINSVIDIRRLTNSVGTPDGEFESRGKVLRTR